LHKNSCTPKFWQNRSCTPALTWDSYCLPGDKET